MCYAQTMRWTMLPSLLVLLLTAACAGPAESGPSPGHSTWRFVSIDGEDPVSPDAQLTFADDRIGANIGCNGMKGPWRIEGDRLIAGPLVQTEIYCPGSVWDQEQALSAMLAGAPRFEVSGDRMVLRSSGHVAELRREALNDES